MDVQQMNTGRVDSDSSAAVEAADLIHQQIYPVALVVKKPDSEVGGPSVFHMESGQPTGKREER